MDMKVYRLCDTVPFKNGADPLWCSGNSTIIRVGEDVFATNMRVFPERGRHSRTSLEVWAKRGSGSWQMEFFEEGVYQREPCPVMYIGGSVIGVTVNATNIVYPPEEENIGALCTPKIYLFDVTDHLTLTQVVTPRFDDPDYELNDHSYRGHALDSANGDLFLVNKYCLGEGSAHAWALLDKNYQTVRADKLVCPKRCCYHNIALHKGELYIFAVRDVEEFVPEWRDYKREVTGDEWDYDMRAIYLKYSPDIRRQDPGEQILIMDRDDTCGHVKNLDCMFTPEGDMLFVASSKRIWHDFMRARFFPNTPFDATLEFFRLRGGKVIDRQVLDCSGKSEEINPKTLYWGGFQLDTEGKAHLFFTKKNAPEADSLKDGLYIVDIDANTLSAPRKISNNTMGGEFFLSRERLGAKRTNRVDFYWKDEGGIYAGEYSL